MPRRIEIEQVGRPGAWQVINGMDLIKITDTPIMPEVIHLGPGEPSLAGPRRPGFLKLEFYGDISPPHENCEIRFVGQDDSTHSYLGYLFSSGHYHRPLQDTVTDLHFRYG